MYIINCQLLKMVFANRRCSMLRSFLILEYINYYHKNGWMNKPSLIAIHFSFLFSPISFYALQTKTAFWMYLYSFTNALFCKQWLQIYYLFEFIFTFWCILSADASTYIFILFIRMLRHKFWKSGNSNHN